MKHVFLSIFINHRFKKNFFQNILPQFLGILLEIRRDEICHSQNLRKQCFTNHIRSSGDVLSSAIKIFSNMLKGFFLICDLRGRAASALKDGNMLLKKIESKNKIHWCLFIAGCCWLPQKRHIFSMFYISSSVCDLGSKSYMFEVIFFPEVDFSFISEIFEGRCNICPIGWRFCEKILQEFAHWQKTQNTTTQHW